MSLSLFFFIHNKHFPYNETRFSLHIHKTYIVLVKCLFTCYPKAIKDFSTRNKNT